MAELEIKLTGVDRELEAIGYKKIKECIEERYDILCRIATYVRSRIADPDEDTITPKDGKKYAIVDIIEIIADKQSFVLQSVTVLSLADPDITDAEKSFVRSLSIRIPCYLLSLIEKKGNELMKFNNKSMAIPDGNVIEFPVKFTTDSEE